MNENYIYPLDRYDVARQIYLDRNNNTWSFFHFSRELIVCEDKGETATEWVHWLEVGRKATAGSKSDLRMLKKAVFELCRIAGYKYEGNL